MRVLWTARRSNQSILKEISPEYSLEGLILKLKLQYFGHLMQRIDSFENTLMLGTIEGGRRRGQQRMRWLDGNHWGENCQKETLFSRSVVSDSLRPHGLQHARPPCASPTPRVYSNSCPFESVMPSNHLIPCRPLLLLPSIFPSIRVFSNESVLHIRWPKYRSFSFSISSSKEYSGLILVSKVLIILNGFSRRFFWCQETLKTGVERDDIGKTIR